MESTLTAAYNGQKKPLILSHLKPLTFNDTNLIFPARAFQIPIPSDTDVSSLVEANDSKILALGTYPEATNNDTLKRTAAQLKKETQLDDKQQIHNFVEISEFYPKNLLQELTTITARNFPNVKRIAVETIWKALLLQGKKEFIWSQIHHELLDENRLLFIRFATIEDVIWFRKVYDISLLRRILSKDDVEICYDNQLDEYMDKVDDEESSSIDSATLTTIEGDIEGFLSNRANFEQELSTTGTEDLDKVMNYYSKYKVDNSELVDVPKTMKEKIIKDIIKFRTKVLTIEKNHRKKEIEQERRKTKERLHNIFNLLQNSSSNKVDKSGLGPVSDTSVSATVLLEDEYEELNDEEYEAMMAEKENAEQQERYNNMLRIQSELMRTEVTRLRNELVALQNYEDDLIDNKFKYVEQVKNFDEFKHLYRVNHSEYLKQRAVAREKEKEFDKQDALEEATEVGGHHDPEPVAVDDKVSVEEVQVQLLQQNDDLDATVVMTDDIIKFDEQSLSKIKTYIGELIEEYLGIKEDLLIDIIYDHILKHSTSSKDKLILELREPLDDDANELVESLWLYIKSI
ncbi:U1 snRNP component [Scheffersomyces spartinae]|uniref:U1 small nuclear ribonucleoprotein component SNU71 n=1 Tax=Scheffersomyces spartinae TaxID=45513 RepID=A0A9P7VAU6_9ASCO|nr:U1 snRNP component [Scheffersomyces spartinae]KAG7194651.1 U1 snRNP component [Scheffersomyces spartinae]